MSMSTTPVTHLVALLVVTAFHLVNGQEPTCQDLDSLVIDSWHLHYIYNQTSEAIADTFTDRYQLWRFIGVILIPTSIYYYIGSTI